jgi:hypothetical protein
MRSSACARQPAVAEALTCALPGACGSRRGSQPRWISPAVPPGYTIAPRPPGRAGFAPDQECPPCVLRSFRLCLSQQGCC